MLSHLGPGVVSGVESLEGGSTLAQHQHRLVAVRELVPADIELPKLREGLRARGHRGRGLKETKSRERGETNSFCLSHLHSVQGGQLVETEIQTLQTWLCKQ